MVDDALYGQSELFVRLGLNTIHHSSNQTRSLLAPPSRLPYCINETIMKGQHTVRESKDIDSYLELRCLSPSSHTSLSSAVQSSLNYNSTNAHWLAIVQSLGALTLDPPPLANNACNSVFTTLL